MILHRTISQTIILVALSACGGTFDSSKFEGDTSAVDLALPSFDQMAASSKASQDSVSVSNPFRTKYSSPSADWGLAAPGSLAEVVCYAIAVEWPNANDRAAKCKKDDGSVMIPGLFQGLYLPGQNVKLRIPSGNNRKIYLLGFAASSASECVELNNAARMNRANLSSPIVLGELNVSLEKGSQSLSITASMAGAIPLSECSGESINGVPAPPPTLEEINPPPPPPPPPPVAAVPPAELPPNANAFGCTAPAQTGLSNGSLACYGLWDFGRAFGEDQNMCAEKDSSAYTSPGVGCQIATPACISGFAVASKVLQIYRPWDSATDKAPMASASELDQIVSRLSASKELVQSNILRVWQYSCAEAVLTSAPPLNPKPPTAPTSSSGAGSLVGTAITCGGYFSNGGSVSAGWPVLSKNQCLAYCDVVANNNPTASLQCRSAGLTLKEYSGPRPQVISPSLALACVARLTNSQGVFDYKAPNAASEEQCRNFCSAVNISGTSKKQCLSYDTVLFDAAAPSSVNQIGSCSVVYDSTVPAGTALTNSCSGSHSTPILSSVASGSPSLVTIEQYETAGYQHGWTIVNGVPKTYRTIGEVVINLAPGGGPIHLAFKSYEPTNIVLTGAVNRIIKMYVVGHGCQSVVGLDPAKVFINSYAQGGFAGLATLRSASSNYAQPLTFAANVKSHIPEVSSLTVSAAFGSYASTCQPTAKTYSVP